jgi:general secretion pathway protein D
VKKITALLLVIGLVNAPAVFAQEATQISSALSSASSDTKKFKARDDYVTLNFTNIDIGALVKVMSELTQRNFLLDEKVTGKVTLMTPTKISPDEAYQVFLSALEIKGFTAIEDGKVTRIIPVASARQSGLKIFQDGNDVGEGYVTKLIRLSFVNPQEIVRTITPLISKDGNIIAYPVTNSVIITDSVSNLRKLESLIHIMDVMAPEGKGKIKVYYLKNANSEELAKLMQALVAKLPAPPAGGVQPAGPATILEGPVNITSDKATNSLIIVASSGDFEVVRDVIQKLDIKRRQVYVECAIVEMSLSKASDIGFEFQSFNQSNNNSQATIGGTNFGDIGSAIVSGPVGLAAISGLAVGVIKGTFTYNGTTYLNVGALLHALQTNGDVNVLSTPNIMAMDNQKAQIMVGENVPFITGQTQNATTGSTAVFNTINREDVGIKLDLTPQISSDDSVRLEVKQEISDVIATTSTNAAGPTTSKRAASTTVVVKDRQTVVIGGLIQDNVTTSTSKVPILGDIPILGWFFKSKQTSVAKTNLMIFITPYIIKNEDDAAEMTKRKNDTLEDFRKQYRIEKKGSEPVISLNPAKAAGTSAVELKMSVTPTVPANALPELNSRPVATTPTNATPGSEVKAPALELRSNAVSTAPQVVPATGNTQPASDKTTDEASPIEPPMETPSPAGGVR